MAEKCNCIYNGNVNQRIAAAKNLAKETDVDGAILFAHWGCKGTIGASSLIKSSLEKDGLPTMILDGGRMQSGQHQRRSGFNETSGIH